MLPGIAPVFNQAVGGGNDSFTKLLLHLNGANGSTVITDSSSSAKPCLANNTATISTAQAKFGTASGHTSAGTDAIYVNNGTDADFSFGVGNFTIEGWFYASALATTNTMIDFRPYTVTGAYPTLYYSNGHFRYFTNSAEQIIGTVGIITGIWYHVAVARSGTSTKMFVNGVQDGGTYTDSNNYGVGAARPLIGNESYTLTLPWNGWFDEIRISKGIARWTSNFTPPSAPYS